MKSISVVATLPFLLHIVTGLYHILDNGTRAKISSELLESCLTSYSIFPMCADYMYHISVAQLALAIVAFLAHFLGNKQCRQLSYAILLTFYAVTQIRLLLVESGAISIGYLYWHIAQFSIFVLYSDHAITPKQKTS